MTALSAGIDLAAFDAAPWSAVGRELWRLAQHRWRRHHEAWRTMGFETRACG
ncbi:MAG TPA: hypothetical protein VGN72_02955 [Tepidisphaeraceae bacterium]|nr:hypothetical protein [Tepidisphaeraceae bacterium]